LVFYNENLPAPEDHRDKESRGRITHINTENHISTTLLYSVALCDLYLFSVKGFTFQKITMPFPVVVNFGFWKWEIGKFV